MEVKEAGEEVREVGEGVREAEEGVREFKEVREVLAKASGKAERKPYALLIIVEVCILCFYARKT